MQLRMLFFPKHAANLLRMRAPVARWICYLQCGIAGLIGITRSSTASPQDDFTAFTAQPHIIEECILREIVLVENGRWNTNKYRFLWQPNAMLVQMFADGEGISEGSNAPAFEGDVEGVWNSDVWRISRNSYHESKLPVDKVQSRFEQSGLLKYVFRGPLSRALGGGIWGLTPGSLIWTNGATTRTNGDIRSEFYLHANPDGQLTGISFKSFHPNGSVFHNFNKFTEFALTSLPFFPTRIEQSSPADKPASYILLIDSLRLGRKPLPRSAFQPDKYLHPGIETFEIDTPASSSPPEAGRIVQGKVHVLPPKALVRWRAKSRLYMPIPKPPTNATSEALAAWLSSESVRRAIAATFAINVTDRGTYALTNVPPGTYRLRIAADLWHPDSPNERDGVIEETVVVPETIDAERAAFIVPDLHIVMFGKIEIGDYIPSVDFTTLDGKHLPLSVFTNKVILLDFWASWCAPCITSIPSLKSLWEEFGREKQFTLLSVSLDRTADDAHRVITRYGLDWPQAYLGTQQQRQIPAMLGFVEVPTLFVLSPGGRVVAKGNDIASLRQAVDQAVSELAARPRNGNVSTPPNVRLE